MTFSYSYPRPAVTVDIIIFRLSDHVPEVLLVQRSNEPFKGDWALPGGFVDKDESLEHAAARELEEETGLKNILLTQMHAFGDPGRDPRGHTVSIVFVGYLPQGAIATAGDDAANAGWFTPEKLPPMAFDHNIILKMATEIFLV